MKDTLDENSNRKAWMSLLAKAPEGRVKALLEAAIPRPAFTWLRDPEIGSTMVRARTGATGAPFNLGEMTVTRCALTLKSGEIGHAYIHGRRKADAEAAAIVDALMQTAAAAQVRVSILEPLSDEANAKTVVRASKAAATKVEFFTMVRGED